MRDDYFDPSFGNRPQNLIGRNKYINEFKNALETRPGSRERSILLLGQRGYGKTVMLLEMADIAGQNGYIVASPTVTSPELTNRILEKLVYSGEKYLSKEKHELTGGNISILGFGAGYQVQGKKEEQRSFAFRLSELCKEFSKKGMGVMLLVDEVQANNEALKQLIIAYQEIVGEGGNIAIVMAGLPGAISSTLNNKVLTFLNRARKMDLSPIEESEIFAYYKEIFNRSAIKISNEQIRRAATFTNGSPYLMQLVGHYIMIYSDESGTLSTEDYESALADAKKDFVNDIGMTTLNELSGKDIEFLTAMSEDDGPSSISKVAERMKVSSAYAQLYKRRLIDAGVIEQTRRGIVDFSVAYLKEYLRNSI